MKRILFTMILLCVIVSIGHSQVSVRTETASDKYVYISAATAGDTVLTNASSIASGSAIRNYNTTGFIVGFAIGSPVASDTIIVKNATETVYTLIQPASEPFVRQVAINAMLDSSLIVVQKKASLSTLIYRIKY
jgi:hypothetical protein